ncbi:MAG: hypothetical protein MUF12_08490, partial [Sediminibacterium sp.]|nr:hypothetical protein [Sediminibacterium sp.]
LFGIFAKSDFKIVFPQPSHSQKKKSNLFEKIEGWKPVRDVLDLADEGNSIFNRDVPLVDKTLERILAGLIKYVANGDKAFLQHYYSGNPAYKISSLTDVCGTLTTIPHQGIVSVVKTKACFMMKYMGNNLVTGREIFG